MRQWDQQLYTFTPETRIHKQTIFMLWPKQRATQGLFDHSDRHKLFPWVSGYDKAVLVFDDLGWDHLINH